MATLQVLTWLTNCVCCIQVLFYLRWHGALLLRYCLSRLWSSFSSPLMYLQLTPDHLRKAILRGNQLWLPLTCLDKTAITILKSRGLSTTPRWIPTLMSNSSLNWPFRLARNWAFSYIDLTANITHFSTPTLLITQKRTFLCTLSKAFSDHPRRNTGVCVYLDVFLVTGVEWRLHL